MAHKHTPTKTHTRCWTGCVCDRPPHSQRAHGGVTKVEVCACGATRETEINGGTHERGSWVQRDEEVFRAVR